MKQDDHPLLLVGKLPSERRRSISGMATAAGLQVAALEQLDQALEWLDSHDPSGVLADAGITRLDKLAAKLRSKRGLAQVPLIALVSEVDDLWVERFLASGGDDTVSIEAGSALLDRLRAITKPSRQLPVACGKAVVADPDRSRCSILGRALSVAGFDVKYASDARSLEFYVKEFAPGLVVVNSGLGDVDTMLLKERAAGNQSAFVVMAPRRELESQQASVARLERVSVIGANATPDELLFHANAVVGPTSVERRAHRRVPFGTLVRFRSEGLDLDDIGFTANLSQGGLLVRSLAPPSSDGVWLELRPPLEKSWVRLLGTVIWRRALVPSDDIKSAAPAGFAVRISDALGRGLELYTQAVQSLVTSQGPTRDPVSSGHPEAAKTEKSEAQTPEPPGAPPRGGHKPPPRPHRSAKPEATELSAESKAEALPDAKAEALPDAKAEAPPKAPAASGKAPTKKPSKPVAAAAPAPTPEKAPAAKASSPPAKSGGSGRSWLIFVVIAAGLAAAVWKMSKPNPAPVPPEPDTSNRVEVPKPVSTALSEASPKDAGSAEATDAAEPAAAQGIDLSRYPEVDMSRGGSGRELAETYGYLVVRFPESAFVLYHGVAIGVTNEKIATRCGERDLRIGVGEKPFVWLSDDFTVDVACRSITVHPVRRLAGVVVPPGTLRPSAASINSGHRSTNAGRSEVDEAEPKPPASTRPSSTATAAPTDTTTPTPEDTTAQVPAGSSVGGASQ